MKIWLFRNSNLRTISIILFLGTITSCSTIKWEVPSAYVGQWNTGEQKITVRTHPKGGYQFTSDSARLTIEINGDKKVSGRIGLAEFDQGILERNTGNPDITGVAYIIKCGRIGKIFENDPLETKEVEIWLSPVEEKMKAELRFTEGMAVFPMGELTFSKR
ncbi:MAG: hypothetical protein NTV09_10645 [Bacteroidetes bacterium]|nr:hypothetical protein [Bacteroidota bacterium]